MPVLPTFLTVPFRTVTLAAELTIPSPMPEAAQVGQSIENPFRSSITLDLNGFSIIGPGAGRLGPSAPGSGNGVEASTSAIYISIINGTVRGMGNNGLELYEQARVERVGLFNNGMHGVRAFAQSIVSRVIAESNGSDGIHQRGATVLHSVASGNGRHGIFANPSGIMKGNFAAGNLGDGINALGSCLVQGNVLESNQGWGLDTGSGQTAYTENYIGGNILGTVEGGTSAIEIGENVCETNTSCP